ncbi:MAG: YCF48-related protein [Ignavibacteriales bacterium]|nr:YCF48-related protein [Ignavibacteriales bacterium]
MKKLLLLGLFLFCSEELFSRQAGWTTTTQPPISSMTSLYAQDANTVLVVGENRTVIRSTDAGVTWTKQHFQISETLNDVRFVDASTIWVVGSSGVLYKTTNGGSTWESVPSGTAKTLYAIATSGSITCAVGSDGKIIRSTNAGATWTAPVSETRLRFYEDIQFTGSTTAVVVGSGSQILRTTDAGSTWSNISLGTSWVKEVSFANSLLGWAVGITASYISITDDIFYGISTNIQGKRSSVWKTTDGGQTWGVGVLPTTNWLDGVHFVDANTGWIVGEGGAILKTADGGTTWNTQTSGTTVRLSSVCFFDNQKGIAIGPSGTILRTTDGGTSWTSVASGTSKNLISVALSSPQLGIAVGEGGTILKTTDGGASWQSLSGGNSTWLYSLCAIGSLDGWAVGTNGTILRTTDGGTTWILKNSGTTDYLQAASFVDKQTGWAVGSTNVFRTDDGGESWTKTWTSSGQYFGAVSFVDKNSGWMAGYKGAYPYEGVIVKTLDGGRVWSEQVIPSSRKLNALRFLDASTGYAVGDSGTILRTTNAGDTWVSAVSGATTTLVSVGFANTSTGWAVGYEGTILKTTDGGKSWGLQSTNATSSSSFYGIHPVSESVAWIAAYGAVLKTNNGGGAAMFTPKPVTPAPNALGVLSGTSFQWNRSVGASTYRLQISNSISFSSAVVDKSGIADTAYVVANLEPTATYYWRVRAEYSGGTSFWSKVQRFETLGITWRNQSVSSYAYLMGVHFVTPSTGWVVGNSGVILKTSNGGKNWNVQNGAGSVYLNSVFFADSLTGWAAGESGKLFVTRDGGSTWISQATGVTQTLNRVRFLNPSKGWIAAGGGVVLRTTDGGSTWLASSTGSSEYVYSVFSLDGSTVWAVDRNGVYKSSDGGATWVKNTTVSYTADMFFTSPQKGWVLAQRGFYRTTNGGVSWLWSEAGTNADLKGLWFLDSLRGWAVGTSGAMVYTADGGATWQTRTSGTTNYLYGLCFVNDSTGWAVGSSTILKATKSPGVGSSTPLILAPANQATSVGLNPTLSWAAVSNATSYRVQVCRYSWYEGFTWIDSSGILSASFTLASLSTETQYYWRVAAYDNDGISNWSEVWSFKTKSLTPSAPLLCGPVNNSTGTPSNVTLYWNRVEDATSYRMQISTLQSFASTFIDQTVSDTSYLANGLSASTEYFWHVRASVGGMSSAYSTTWKFTTIIVGPPMPSLAAPPNQSVSVPLNSTLRWNRSVGAASYRVQLSSTADFSALLFDKSVADTVCPATGLIANTTYYWRVNATDSTGTCKWAGAWSFVTSATGWVKTSGTYGLSMSVTFVDQSLGWMSTYSGDILKTTDGGSSWTTQTSGTSSVLYSICFVNSSVGWAAGSKGVIVKTSNGGTQWMPQTSGTAQDIKDIDFVDTQTGWAVTQDGLVLKTTDGGSSWNSQTVPTTTYLNGVDAIDPQRAYVVGASVVFKTTDGGATWISQAIDAFAYLMDVFFLNSQLGWTVGADARMLKTTDGGASWVSQSPPTLNWLTGIRFIDASRGWAVGWNGTVMKTTDGGTTWGLQRTGSTGSFYALHCLDTAKVWAVGSGLYKTNDGGGPMLFPSNLVVPSNGAKNVSLTPALTWTGVPNAVSYQVQVSYYANFTPVLLTVNTLSSVTTPIGPLSLDKTHYWRVIATLNDSLKLVSAAGQFSTIRTTQAERLDGVPSEFALYHNYPNPFNPSTRIQFDIPHTSFVTLKVYTALGVEVATLVSSELSAGRFEAVWNAGNVSSGIYFYRIQAGTYTHTRKMVLLR